MENILSVLKIRNAFHLDTRVSAHVGNKNA